MMRSPRLRVLGEAVQGLTIMDALVPIVRRVAIGYHRCSTALDRSVSCMPSTKDQGVGHPLLSGPVAAAARIITGGEN